MTVIVDSVKFIGTRISRLNIWTAAGKSIGSSIPDVTAQIIQHEVDHLNGIII